MPTQTCVKNLNLVPQSIKKEKEKKNKITSIIGIPRICKKIKIKLRSTISKR